MNILILAKQNDLENVNKYGQSRGLKIIVVSAIICTLIELHVEL